MKQIVPAMRERGVHAVVARDSLCMRLFAELRHTGHRRHFYGYGHFGTNQWSWAQHGVNLAHV